MYAAIAGGIWLYLSLTAFVATLSGYLWRISTRLSLPRKTARRTIPFGDILVSAMLVSIVYVLFVYGVGAFGDRVLTYTKTVSSAHGGMITATQLAPLLNDAATLNGMFGVFARSAVDEYGATAAHQGSFDNT